MLEEKGIKMKIEMVEKGIDRFLVLYVKYG